MESRTRRKGREEIEKERGERQERDRLAGRLTGLYVRSSNLVFLLLLLV